MFQESRIGASEYRPFIDGLRAIAILAVVGYHIGIPGFSGGFIGVDVFFVISGFLIIGHIAERMQQGRFSLTDFYARRILRLLPLLLTVLLVTCGAAAAILLTPEEYKDFGLSAMAAAVMLSNHFFLSNQGYFDTAAETKPLLHTWSLGVEAQFYVVIPFFLWALTRKSIAQDSNRMLIAGGTIVSLFSFIGCIHFTDAAKNAAFFLMPYRAWEFVAGAAAGALARYIKQYSAAVHVLGLLGLAMIIACIFFYSPELLYPFWYPILPVLGATLVISAGEANTATPVCQFLATRPFVGIGLISYGWYLWHWPLLTLGRIHRFGNRDLMMDILIGGVASFILAVATYFLIERVVIRNKARLLTQRRIVTVGLGLAACLLVAVPGKIYQKVVAHAAAANLSPEAWPQRMSLKKLSDPCIMSERGQIGADCLPATSNKSFGILFGDSHAREAYAVLNDKATKSDAAFITFVKSGCPPLLGTEVLFHGKAEKCGDTWKAGLKTIEDQQAKLTFAIIEADWGIYVGSDNAYRAKRVLALPDDKTPAPDQGQALASSLKETIQSLRELGIQRVLLVAPEPQFLHDGRTCMIRAHRLGYAEDICARPQAEVETQHLDMLNNLRAVSQDNPDVRVIDPFKAICDGTLCRQHLGGIPTYIDDNHLSKAGNELLFDTFADDFNWAFGKDTKAAIQ